MPVFKYYYTPSKQKRKEYLGVISMNEAIIALLRTSYLKRDSVIDIIQPLYLISKTSTVSDAIRIFIEKNVRYLQVQSKKVYPKIIFIKDIMNTWLKS